MDDYSTLVSKVLANKQLADAIEDEVDENCINLIADDWSERLKNNAIFQDFLSKDKKMWKPVNYVSNYYEFQEANFPDFEIVLVAHCKLGKLYENKQFRPNVIVMDSEPLATIASTMMLDFGPNIQISNEFKFIFNDCGILSCTVCKQYADLFTKAGFVIKRYSQPCIQDTKLFDGKEIVNRFYCQIEPMFNQKFISILRLKINKRYFYFDDKNKKIYKIHGLVKSFLGFTENKLSVPKPVNVGTLVKIEICENLSEKPKKKMKKEDDSEFENFIEDTLSLEEEETGKKRKIDEGKNKHEKKVKFCEEENEMKRKFCEEEDFEEEDFLL